MGDYVLICRRADDAAAEALSAELGQEALRQGLAVSELNPHTWLAVRGPTPPRRLQVGGWTLIGDVFNRRSPNLPRTQASDPWDYERKMVARFWGRFVGVRFGANDQVAALLRDPSGALECVSWVQDGLTLVCSSAERWLINRLKPDWNISVERLSQAMLDPVAGTGRLLLDGPTALEPGTAQPLPLTLPPEILWSPSNYAAQSLARPPSTDEAMARLRTAIEEAVVGLANLPGPIAAEVSGGLDSSIVASALLRHTPDTVRLWLNTYGSTPESDERDHVANLGRWLGIEPLCIPHATGRMTRDWLDDISDGFRPGWNALDYPQDLAWAREISASGATAVMSGKGGDSILVQAATKDVFADVWRARGWRALGNGDLIELAAANELSVWSMVHNARRHRRGEHRPPRRDHPLIASESAEAAIHPWLANLKKFGPAKAFQIAGVADSVSHHGPSALSRSIDVRHPLCAQPVIETCLSLPTSLLTIGGRDRGLARRAFQEHLPSTVIDRRSKGEMTRIYGRMIVENLDFLRPWLIDGRLAALGVIDRAAAEVELTAEALIWRGNYAVIFAAAALEGWVRLWEQRVGPAR